jgi:hypothetical protein
VHYLLAHPLAIASVTFPLVFVIFSLRLVRSVSRRGTSAGPDRAGTDGRRLHRRVRAHLLRLGNRPAVITPDIVPASADPRALRAGRGHCRVAERAGLVT